MYGCASWAIKKAECQRIDAFELRCQKRLLRVHWTASACVVGGVSASGGAGSILGMVIGATLIGVINLGMFQISLDANYQRVVKGFVLLAAVVFDILSKKKQS